MQIAAKDIEDYLEKVPIERRVQFRNLWNTISENIPKGFEACLSYGMPGYVVPHSIYPNGYHIDPSLPLPFLSIASQKNFIGFYHMGIYTNPALLKWFQQEYPKHSKNKLDMGKSCVRLKKPDQLPLELIAELVSKMSVQDWIDAYEEQLDARAKG